VYDRAHKSLLFLRTCMVEENGWLPNYGANDGALFFKLSHAHYRDFRPQIQALANVLGTDAGIGILFEDAAWYGVDKKMTWTCKPADGIHTFSKGGYYIIREPDTLTFIKCGSYKDRPSQADNLHIDVWYKGENILLDAGSYKYNTDAANMRYFSGTASHNTVMIDDKDQMLKGGHFIWYYWSQCKDATLQEDAQAYTFTGAVNAFSYIKYDIVHRRTIIKQKGKPVWKIKDELIGVPEGMQMRQLWHQPVNGIYKTAIVAKDVNGVGLLPHIQDGWSSSFYGQKEKTLESCFSTENKIIDTLVKVESDT